ncbi:MAG: GDSL-type esterase/lipase family protein [Deltaproteobacteria bacterium]|nr:GDSL-type esterase/lipase family protein [Deltaproteobacteria bacterium]
MRKNTKLLFIGDSITHYWENEGLEIWKSFYSKYNPLNLGLGGDQTQHILYRLNQYDFTELTPKVSVVLAGTNNLALGHSPEDTARGVKKIVDKLKKISPSTSIILLALFPRGHEPNHLRKLIKSTNFMLSTYFRNDNRVHFLDLGAHFMDKAKVISSNIMRDYLHLTSEGYKIWAKQMDPLLKKLLSE